jgi:UDP-sugar pyrophosphorylase
MEKLQASSADFERMEKLGAEQLEHTGFVLVAGGLGERLNFPGIKVALPIETTSNKCFLQYYVEQLLEYEYQAAANKGLRRGDAAWRSIPLAIMTSDDTHERTVKLLEQHDYFGMNRAQVTLMKQDLVPAVADMNGRLVVENYHLVRKPHGHGDVHLLMHRTGLADKV